MAAISGFFIGLLICFVSVFMVLLILIQRGRGGGITGALGGAGGQSAFGSKAGDVFTRITVVTAGIWIFLCMLLIVTNNRPDRSRAAANKGASSSGGLIDESGQQPGQDEGEGEPGDGGIAPGVAAPGADDLVLPGEENPAETQAGQSPPADSGQTGQGGATAPAAGEGAAVPVDGASSGDSNPASADQGSGPPLDTPPAEAPGSGNPATGESDGSGAAQDG